MREVSVIGVGSTPFGKLEGQGLRDMATAAANEALADAGIDRKQIQAFYLGNFASDSLVGQGTVAPLVANALGLPRIPTTKVEGACASAGIAFRHGYMMVATGICDFVLVVGVEKMSSASTAKVTQALSGAADIETEAKCGLTFPGAFALAARRHMHQYGTTRKQIGLVSVKNRRNALKNPKAQFRKEVSIEEVLESRMIADPLRLYDCCPISDGAAAAVLCSAEVAAELSKQPIDVIGSGHVVGPTTLYQTKDLTGFEATQRAADQAFEMARISRDDVDLAEVHDCFTIAEIIATEDLGFFEKGKGGCAVEEGATQIGGRIPINTAGGLLTKGHPVGATGLGQIYEVVRQLRGQAYNQVRNAEIGLAHNLGGTGAVATVHILRSRN
ncbi:MAG: thiolase domain-containing protein [Chloroflexi bacterium]|nr:thiolase domain-containing protein [Chloroflexota bacterium]